VKTPGENLLKRFILCVLMVGCIAAVPSSATAQTLDLTGASGPVQGGVFTFPYQITLNGGPSLNVACDDFFDSESVPSSWQANVFSFGANGVPTGGLFTGFSGSTALYDKAAWLFTQMLAHPSQSANINFAIWGLFDSAAKGNSGYTTTGAGSSASWATAADTWYAGAGDVASLFSADNFILITPATGNYLTSNEPQEFIYELMPTPEPASILLGAIGFAFLAWAVFRRKSAFPLLKN
jgi:PEP-CTERM motif